MIGIDLFSGAGGMSLGALKSGIDVQLVVESDPHACATYKKNHSPSLGIFNKDIKLLDPLAYPLDRRNGIVLFGGPPCQGYSTSNQRTRSSTNSSNWLFREFLRVVDAVEPDWVVFENVKGILETENGIFVKEIDKHLVKKGYTTSHGILCAHEFGVPQKRVRFFIVASKHGIQFQFPSPNTEKKVTVKEAIEDLPFLENGASKCYLPYRSSPKSSYALKMRANGNGCTNHLVTKNNPVVIERYKHVPQGGNWENIPNELMENYKDRQRCHTGIYRRLIYSEPSVVIGNYRKNMLIHPLQNRGLSVREAARLQSFPDTFEFTGSIGFQQQQVGNAVPPLLAETLFSSIINQS